MPGVILDPRQNPNEKKTGIVYFEEDFEVEDTNETLSAGNYFYEKEMNDTDDFKNSRYYSNGFPVKAKSVANDPPDPDDWQEYSQIFCRLSDEKVLLLKNAVDEDNLDQGYPMAAYLHRAISHGTANPISGRGLKKIGWLQNYSYHREPFDVGGLTP
jgi:hypothetical protein